MGKKGQNYVHLVIEFPMREGGGGVGGIFFFCILSDIDIFVHFLFFKISERVCVSARFFL